MSTAVPDGDGPAEDLFSEAPCGWVLTDPRGAIVRVNRSLLDATGYAADDLVSVRRIQDLLTASGRIFYQTHVDPLLRLQGFVSQIAVEFVRADGSPMPALLNAVLRRDRRGDPYGISVIVIDASDRRRYEDGLLQARRREQEIAHELQRSMLTGPLPVDPRFVIDVIYRPATAGLQVGGDWYDAFWLDDDHRRVGLVIGDVVGRGLGAAAAMGQLRSAVRAIAITGCDPGALLDVLDTYAARHETGQSATVLYAEIDLAARELRFACAGHPPPVVIPPDAAATFDWGGRSTPLDVSARGTTPRAFGTRRLVPGATVMLYTDGLTERRSHPQEDGLQRLLDTVASERVTRRGVTLASAVVRALHSAENADDVCVLAIEMSSELPVESSVVP